MDSNIIIDVLVWLGIIWMLLKMINSWSLSKLEQLSEELREVKELIHVVKPEFYGSTIYWFDQETDMFLGQGENLDDIVAVLKTRFPRHVFFFADQNGKYAIGGPEWIPKPIEEFVKQ